jgi:anti-sigma regulatory factor (Ser/Thr protein kinase)
MARAFVTEAAYAAGLGRDAVGDIEVAVGEAVTNALLYGCVAVGDRPDAVLVTVAEEHGSFVVEICDRGPGFDERLVRHTAPGDGEEIGGRGLLLMRALMDRVEVHCDARGTRVRLERFLPE